MSSGSESDEDYVPGEPEKVSEEESANEEIEAQFEDEDVQKTKKRKSKLPARGKKKLKTRSEKEILNDDQIDTVDEPVVTGTNPVEEKKREDDLWAKFLEGTDTKPKPIQEVNKVDNSKSEIIKDAKTFAARKNETKQDDKDREKRIFEFAGETIVVENNVIKEKVKTSDSAAKVSKYEAPSRSGGGLSNVLGQLNKKNNLSTLEKSKLDWNTYKREEGIEEEIVSHNKGKAGFLDRRDFLERTDVRQYEIERDLRMSKRSNR